MKIFVFIIVQVLQGKARGDIINSTFISDFPSLFETSRGENSS
jgi:hypothetical protein